MNKIFGYGWDDIKRAQQGDMSGMRRPIEGEQDDDDWTPVDQHLLDQYQTIEALEDAGLYGVADRAKRKGIKVA